MRSGDNPFRYGGVALDDAFTDRAAELAELVADMRSGHKVAIISPRRFGKTSLLFRAIKEFRTAGALVAYVDLFRATTRERLAATLARAIHEGLLRPRERAWEKVAGYFGHLPLAPQATLGQDGSVSFSFGAAARAVDLDATIERLLELPATIAEHRKSPVALVLDEFQEVVGIDPDLVPLMRSVFQEQPAVAHIFAGSRRHLMESVFTGRNQAMYRLAKRVALGPIPAEDFAGFITAKFARTGLTIVPPAVGRILALTGCHPHYTQELCHFIWYAAAARKGPVDEAAVELGLQRVLAAEDAHFNEVWSRLTSGQRLLTLALAEEGREPLSEALRTRHQLGAASTVQYSLKKLQELDLVLREKGDTYVLADPFFKVWLARRKA